MPYKPFKVNGRYCVYKVNEEGKRTGESLGCHSSRSEAQAQITAINIEENKSIKNKWLVFVLPDFNY